MLISHSHKFVTIDIQKTGTRSMRESLYPLGIIDVLGRADRHGEFYQHGTALDAEREFHKRRTKSVGTDWNWQDYFKFSFVRDPWKRCVSFMLYRKERAEEYNNASDEEKVTWPQAKLNQGRSCLAWDKRFETDKQKLVNSIETFDSQQQMICDENDECMMDMLGDTSNFKESFEQFCDAVNIDPIPEIIHGNKGTYTKPYTEYYDQETIDMVALKEQWVINKIGYDYE